jgi:ribosomal protein S18 acetylase RimI-like enzyme
MNTFEKVRDQTSIDTVVTLANEIWNQHFVSIIGQDQVDYMLDKLQSSNAIAKQLNNGYEYYIISNDHKNVGYLGLLSEDNLSRMMISKIYIKSEDRSLGVGGSALKFLKELSKERNIKTIWLTVNKHNKDTIEWYLRKSFVVVEEVKKDIGSGFFMDDYIMEMKND